MSEEFVPCASYAPPRPSQGASPAVRVIVLAAGRGRRMQVGGASVPLTAEQEVQARAGWKALIPVDGRPFLDHLLDQLRAGGIEHVCVVVGPGEHPVRGFLAARPADSLEVTMAVQETPAGTADALRAAAGFLSEGPTIVVNGDNLYPTPVIEAVRSLPGIGLAGFRATPLLSWSDQPRSRLTSYALLRVDDHGHLLRIEEKPSWSAVQAMGPEPLVSMNCWRFTPEILEVLADLEPSARGELEIPDAVRRLLLLGVSVRVAPVSAAVPDLTTVEDIPRVTAYLHGEGSR
jgi:dTDP-glucose pyrophosphorylase